MDEHAFDWSDSELARLEDGARQSEIARDRANVRAGQALLADYLTRSIRYPDAFRAYMRDLMAARAAGDSWQRQPRRPV